MLTAAAATRWSDGLVRTRNHRRQMKPVLSEAANSPRPNVRMPTGRPDSVRSEEWSPRLILFINRSVDISVWISVAFYSAKKKDSRKEWHEAMKPLALDMERSRLKVWYYYWNDHDQKERQWWSTTRYCFHFSQEPTQPTSTHHRQCALRP